MRTSLSPSANRAEFGCCASRRGRGGPGQISRRRYPSRFRRLSALDRRFDDAIDPLVSDLSVARRRPYRSADRHRSTDCFAGGLGEERASRVAPRTPLAPGSYRFSSTVLDRSRRGRARAARSAPNRHRFATARTAPRSPLGVAESSVPARRCRPARPEHRRVPARARRLVSYRPPLAAPRASKDARDARASGDPGGGASVVLDGLAPDTVHVEWSCVVLTARSAAALYGDDVGRVAMLASTDAGRRDRPEPAEEYVQLWNPARRVDVAVPLADYEDRVGDLIAGRPDAPGARVLVVADAFAPSAGRLAARPGVPLFLIARRRAIGLTNESDSLPPNGAVHRVAECRCRVRPLRPLRLGACRRAPLVRLRLLPRLALPRHPGPVP